MRSTLAEKTVFTPGNRVNECKAVFLDKESSVLRSHFEHNAVGARSPCRGGAIEVACVENQAAERLTSVPTVETPENLFLVFLALAHWGHQLEHSPQAVRAALDCSAVNVPSRIEHNPTGGCIALDLAVIWCEGKKNLLRPSRLSRTQLVDRSTKIKRLPF